MPLFCSADRFLLRNSVETIIFGGASAGSGKGRKDDMSILPTRNTPCNTNSGCNLQVPKKTAGLAVICLLCPGSDVMSEIKRVPPCRDQRLFTTTLKACVFMQNGSLSHFQSESACEAHASGSLMQSTAGRKDMNRANRRLRLWARRSLMHSPAPRRVNGPQYGKGAPEGTPSKSPD